MKIRDWDSDSGSVFIIAEIGSNHEGDFRRAWRMTEAAIAAGADAVKFQVYNPDTLVSPDMPALVPTHETQLERMRSLQFTLEQYRSLAALAHERGKAWIASAFDRESADLVTEIGDAIKIASGELPNRQLLEYIAALGKPVIASTGMATMHWRNEFRGEIVDLISPFDFDAALLHCVSLYPCPVSVVNLDMIRRLAELTFIPGYSDHCIGADVALASVAAGARIVEKHFTDLAPTARTYGDHVHSLDQVEFADMVRRIRIVEQAMRPWQGERPDVMNRDVLRRCPKTGLRGNCDSSCRH